MEIVNYKSLHEVPLHEILFAITSEIDYEMDRLVLLEHRENHETKFILIEGWHCSCYDFDDTQWEGLVMTEEELEKLLENVSEYQTLRMKLKDFLKYYKGEW